MMIKHIKKLLLAASFVLGFFGVTSANALPISAGLPPAAVIEDESFVALQYQNVYFTESGQAAGFTDSKANINVYAFIAAHVYDKGRLTVYSILPYVQKSFGTMLVPPAVPAGTPPTAFGFQANGLADPVVGAQYVWARKPWEGGYMASSVFSTLTLPLGTYNIPGIPRLFNPGGGNFVPTVGVTYFMATPKVEIYVVLSYGVPLQARGYKAGNVLNYAAELGYTVVPWKFKSLTSYPVIVKALVEFLGTLTGRIKTNNPAVDFAPQNTGGTVFRIAPGLFIEWHGYDVGLSYQFPVSESTNGAQPIKQHQQIVASIAHYW